MLRRVSHNSAVAEKSSKKNIWDYFSKRDCISELLVARNQGNDRASAMLEHILELLAGSGNRNAGIAATLLDRCHKYATLLYSEGQINGLAIMAAELGYAIPKCPDLILVDQQNAPPEDFVCANDEFDTVEEPQLEEEEPKWTPDPEGICMSDIVEFVDTETGDVQIMKIVKSGLSDMAKKHLAINTPVALALVGHLPGDVVSAHTPIGTRTIQINSITR